MKSFTFSLLLICLAYVGFAQVAFGPPVDSEAIAFAAESQMSTADIIIAPAVNIKTAENRIGVEHGSITSTLLYRPEYSVTTTTAEMPHYVSDIDVGVSITNAVMNQRLTPDNKQRLTPNDARLTVERSKQSQSPSIAYTYNYLPGFVGWSR